MILFCINLKFRTFYFEHKIHFNAEIYTGSDIALIFDVAVVNHVAYYVENFDIAGNIKIRTGIGSLHWKTTDLHLKLKHFVLNRNCSFLIVASISVYIIFLIIFAELETRS